MAEEHSHYTPMKKLSMKLEPMGTQSEDKILTAKMLRSSSTANISSFQGSPYSLQPAGKICQDRIEALPDRLVWAIDTLRLQYPYLFSKERQTIDVDRLKQDKYYHKYFLLKDGNIDKRGSGFTTSAQRFLSMVRHLEYEKTQQRSPACVSKESSKSVPYVRVKLPRKPGYWPTPKCRTLRVKRHTHNLSMQVNRENAFDKWSNKDITFDSLLHASSIRVLAERASTHNKDNHPTSQPLTSAAPSPRHGVVSDELKGPALTQYTIQARTREETRRYRNKLVSMYAHRPLSEFVEPEKIKKPEDVASALDHVMKWNVARLYKHTIKPNGYQRPDRADQTPAEFMALNDCFVQRLHESRTSHDLSFRAEPRRLAQKLGRYRRPRLQGQVPQELSGIVPVQSRGKRRINDVASISRHTESQARSEVPKTVPVRTRSQPKERAKRRDSVPDTTKNRIDYQNKRFRLLAALAAKSKIHLQPSKAEQKSPLTLPAEISGGQQPVKDSQV